MRRNRKTIGLIVNRAGLIVRVPLHATSNSIEQVLHRKAAWVISKLDAWKEKKFIYPVWEQDSQFWLLGEPYRLVLTASSSLQMMPRSEQVHNMEFAAGIQLMPQQIERFVMAWYREQAEVYMRERVIGYASQLGVPTPKLRLSNARTRWGSCSSSGTVCLNWRLIQLPTTLVDYVVAHELAHLIEMNHSAAFWKVVEGIYPDYRQARSALKKIG
ncbi:MAG: M48 family metallopeptidase [Nitrosomonas sp.]|nr:M48 family metallopeptidase [Nitrosomonas sp.]